MANDLHQVCIEQLAIVFGENATNQERRAAALTIVEAIAPDVLQDSIEHAREWDERREANAR